MCPANKRKQTKTKGSGGSAGRDGKGKFIKGNTLGTGQPPKQDSLRAQIKFIGSLAPEDYPKKPISKMQAAAIEYWRSVEAAVTGKYKITKQVDKEDDEGNSNTITTELNDVPAIVKGIMEEIDGKPTQAITGADNSPLIPEALNVIDIVIHGSNSN